MTGTAVVYAKGAVRAEARKGRTQRIRVHGPTLRKEANLNHSYSPEDGRTFENLGDYLEKYHPFRHFTVTAIARDGMELVVDIRHIGWLERLKNWVRGQ